MSSIASLRGFFLMVCLTFVVGACQAPQGASEPPPNIVLLYADDFGWMDMGVQGSDYYETPHLDRLAAMGMRFTQAYANAANCAPSRACLMTGLYPPRHGIYTVSRPDRGAAQHRKLIPAPNTTVLDTALLTLPQHLRAAGYRTCIAGKWHLSPDPLDYGFDTNFGGGQRGAPPSYFSPYKNPQLPDGPPGEHLPDRLARELSQWIRENKEQPFFVYFPFYSVHTPIQAREDLTRKYAEKAPGRYHNKPEYAAMIEAMDAAAGKVLETLEAEGLAERTLVIFTADNGSHGPQTLSRPLRGAKGMFYEGGIRVPMIVRWPGKVAPGSVCEAPVIGLDLFPTLAEAANAPLPASTQPDGWSLLPLLAGDSLPQRDLYWHFPAYLEMYEGDRAFEDARDKPWFRTTPVSVIRRGPWKMLEYFEEGDTELYHLGTDLGEQNDLSEAEPAVKAELREALRTWQTQTRAPRPAEPNPEYVPWPKALN